jgi:hypothetical protein
MAAGNGTVLVGKDIGTKEEYKMGGNVKQK